MGDEDLGGVVLEVAREDEVLRNDYAERCESGAIGGDERVRKSAVRIEVSVRASGARKGGLTEEAAPSPSRAA